MIRIILDDVFGDQRDLVLTHELYTLSARNRSFRNLTAAWMARSRAALEHHFDPETARLLDALIEGLTIHRALDVELRETTEVERAVDRMIGDGGQAADLPAGDRRGGWIGRVAVD